MKKQVLELQAGELFIWEQQPDYLHQMTDAPLQFDKLYALHVATCNESGEWRMLKNEAGNYWNPYCEVEVVKLTVVTVNQYATTVEKF